MTKSFDRLCLEFRRKLLVSCHCTPLDVATFSFYILFLFYFSENNTIIIWNNGKGIPVVEHKVEKVYVPALIFGQLLTSSNYDDDEKKVTGVYK